MSPITLANATYYPLIVSALHKKDRNVYVTLRPPRKDTDEEREQEKRIGTLTGTKEIYVRPALHDWIKESFTDNKVLFISFRTRCMTGETEIEALFPEPQPIWKT